MIHYDSLEKPRHKRQLPSRAHEWLARSVLRLSSSCVNVRPHVWQTLFPTQTAAVTYKPLNGCPMCPCHAATSSCDIHGNVGLAAQQKQIVRFMWHDQVLRFCLCGQLLPLSTEWHTNRLASVNKLAICNIPKPFHAAMRAAWARSRTRICTARLRCACRWGAMGPEAGQVLDQNLRSGTPSGPAAGGPPRCSSLWKAAPSTSTAHSCG